MRLVDDRTNYCVPCDSLGHASEGISYCSRCRQYLCLPCVRQHIFKCIPQSQTSGIADPKCHLQTKTPQRTSNHGNVSSQAVIIRPSMMLSGNGRGEKGCKANMVSTKPTTDLKSSFSARGGVVRVVKAETHGNDAMRPESARSQAGSCKILQQAKDGSSQRSSRSGSPVQEHAKVTDGEKMNIESINTSLEELIILGEKCQGLCKRMEETKREVNVNSEDMDSELNEYKEHLIAEVNSHMQTLRQTKDDIVAKHFSVSKQRKFMFKKLASSIEAVVSAVRIHFDNNNTTKAWAIIDGSQDLVMKCKKALSESTFVEHPMIYLEKNGTFVNTLCEPEVLGKVVVVDRSMADSSTFVTSADGLNNTDQRTGKTAVLSDVEEDIFLSKAPEIKGEHNLLRPGEGLTTGKNILIDTLNLERFGQFDSISNQKVGFGEGDISGGYTINFNVQTNDERIYKDERDVSNLPLDVTTTKEPVRPFFVRYQVPGTASTLTERPRSCGQKKSTQGRIISFDDERINDLACCGPKNSRSAVSTPGILMTTTRFSKPPNYAWINENKHKTTNDEPRKPGYSSQCIKENTTKTMGRDFLDDFRRTMTRDESEYFNEAASIDSYDFETISLKKKGAKLIRMNMHETQTCSGKSRHRRESGHSTPRPASQRFIHPARCRLVLIKKVLIKLPTDGSHCEINCVDCMPDGRLVVSDNANQCIKIFHRFKQGAAILRLEEAPHAMAVVSHTAIAVLCGLAFDKLLLVNVGSDLIVKKCFTIGSACRSICADDMKIYLLCIRNYETEVVIMNADGVVSMKLKLGHILNAPQCIGVCRSSGKIVLTDACAGVFTADVARRRVNQCVDKTVERYYGIAADYDGNVFVCCGHPDGVRELSTDGQYLVPVLGGNDVTNVTYVCHNYHDNTLIVGGSCSDFVKVYQIQKSTNEKRN